MEHFNGLTPAQAERLSLLLEEAGEVLQVIGKIQRHGLYSCHPTTLEVNKDLLEVELGHFINAIDLLVEANDVSLDNINSSKEYKAVDGRRYFHHQ